MIYAHRAESPWHVQALDAVRGLAEGTRPWAIPWPCLHEFMSVTTHPRMYSPPTPLNKALRQVTAWAEAPHLFLLGETASCLPIYVELADQAQITGPRLYDARIAALCLHHGVDELWTADRDFGRFPRLKTRNPLVARRG